MVSVLFLIYISSLDANPSNKLCKLTNDAKLLSCALTKNDKLNIQKDLEALGTWFESLVNRFECWKVQSYASWIAQT